MIMIFPKLTLQVCGAKSVLFHRIPAFEGTIAENIALNDPNAVLNRYEAAKIACANEFIMELGMGYATPVAERGSNLSGGKDNV